MGAADSRSLTRRLEASLTDGLATPLLDRIGIGSLPTRLASVGLYLMVAGLGLRVWSAQTLGRFYTRTLRVAEDQQVVRDSPYRWVRHPGYAADILMWLGFGLASRNGLVGGCIVLVMVGVYLRRIAAEEAMLVVHLGGAYQDYMRETSRLLPSVY